MWENKKEMPNHDDGLFLPKKIRGFHGTPKKIRLESNNISYGSCPAPDDEVEQHLTINDQGRMWLTVFRFGSGFAQHKQCRAISHAIGKSKAQRILAAIAQHFVDYQPCFATDVGVWKLCITNTENEKFLYHGSLCQCDFDGNDSLSELLRDELRIDDLYAFDGQCRPDPIECLTIDYHRLSVPKAVAHETERCMVWEYKEKLTICRETDTIEYIQTISPECVASHKYHVAYGISDLLDTFSTDSFFRYTLQTPDDVVENPDERREYTLTVAFQRRPPLQLQGVYDKYDLPLGWNEMIEKIWSFIRFYGLCGEIMDPEVYNSVRRRKSDLIFLYVQFDDGYKEYCYLADEDIYAKGDCVDVPVGSEERITVAEVTRVAYLQAANAPFPLDKIKRVAGHHPKSENNAQTAAKEPALETDELELQDFGIMTEPFSKEAPVYHLKKLFDYCKKKNIKPEAMTDEEITKFLG